MQEIKKLLFITGTRADFGKMKGIMRALEKSDSYEMHVLVTGMHMLKRYGATYLEVKSENFEHAYFVPNQGENDSMSCTLGTTISIFSKLVREIEPDLIIVHGDRLEALAGAAVGALNNRPVCHIEGGELSGSVDELIRHAVSKLSHIHMVANDDAKKRLYQLGEQPSSIHVVGSPDLDLMLNNALPTLEAAKERYEIDFPYYAVSILHPVTTAQRWETKRDAEIYFQALKKSGDFFIVVFPNNDFGSDIIIDELDSLGGNFKVFPSIRFEYFLTFLKNAKYIIGNSSAGIREAPYYGVPTINVGNRQARRSNSEEITAVNFCAIEIINAIKEIKEIEFKQSKEFGDGTSIKKILEIIERDDFWEIETQKKFIDVRP